MKSWGDGFQKGLAAAESGDYATALKEWMPLAEQGYGSAQFNLGIMYKNGQGVLQNDKTAVKWWTLSANQGHASAQSRLGFMHYTGQGVQQDYQTAVKWYILSAQQGHATAQASLSLMHAMGLSVPQDNVYAHMWSNIADSNGNKDGTILRDILAKKMTPSQIEEAQRLARECVAKNYKGC